MLENEFLLTDKETDSIDFSNLQIPEEIVPEIITDEKDEKVIESFCNDYMINLRDTYSAEESLFLHLEDLIDESDDKELLIKMLDSL
jgi:hypothetical protein